MGDEPGVDMWLAPGLTCAPPCAPCVHNLAWRVFHPFWALTLCVVQQLFAPMPTKFGDTYLVTLRKCCATMVAPSDAPNTSDPPLVCSREATSLKIYYYNTVFCSQSGLAVNSNYKP